MSFPLRKGPSGPELFASFQRLLGNDSDPIGAIEDVSISQALDWIPGEDATEWVFDGIDDNANVGVSKYAFERTDSWSHSFWFQTDGSLEGTFIGNAENSVARKGWSSYIFSGGGVHFKLSNERNVNDLDVSTLNSFNDGVLHHCVITYNGSSLAAGVQIFVDNVLQTLSTILNSLSLTTVSTGTLRIGILGSLGINAYNGILKQFTVFPGVVLSAGQVSSLYNAGVPPNVSALGLPNLGSYWKFNDQDTTLPGGIHDYGSNGFNATADGGLTRSPEGDLIVRGATVWERVTAGNQNAPLLSAGLGQKPYYPPLGSLVFTGFTLFVPVSVLAGGGVRDLVVYQNNAPFDFRIVDATMYTTAAIGGSSVTARSASGGGGTAYTNAMTTTATGVSRNAILTGTSIVPAGGSLFLRFTDGRVGGQFVAPIILT